MILSTLIIREMWSCIFNILIFKYWFTSFYLLNVTSEITLHCHEFSSCNKVAMHTRYRLGVGVYTCRFHQPGDSFTHSECVASLREDIPPGPAEENHHKVRVWHLCVQWKTSWLLNFFYSKFKIVISLIYLYQIFSKKLD